MTLQQTDYETSCSRSTGPCVKQGGKSAHAPSFKQILYWLETYGFDCTEQGIARGLPAFLKKMPNGRVFSGS